MGLGSKLYKGATFRLITLIIQIVIAFFMIPFIIHSLGDVMYGVWILVGVFVGYSSFLDLGISSSVERYISRMAGRGEDDESNLYISSAFCLFVLLGFFAFFVILGFFFNINYFVESAENIDLYKSLLLIVGLSFSLSFPMRIFQGILNANLRHDLTSLAMVFKTTVSALAIYLLLSNGFGVLQIVIATAIIDFISQMLNMIFAYSIHKNLSIDFRKIRIDKIKELLSYSSKTFVSQVADVLRFRIDNFVIALYVGLAPIVFYAVAVKLAGYLSQIIQNIFSGLKSYYSFHEGQDNFDLIRKRFLSATKICTAITTFIGTSMILYGDIFINRWMGPGYEQSYTLLVMLLIPSMIALMQNPGIGLMYGISKHHNYAIMNICEGVLNLILSLILVRYYGLYGVVLGTVIEMMLFKLFVQPVMVCRIINVPLFKDYYLMFAKTILKVVVPICLYYFMIRDLMSENYLSIVIAGLGQSILVLPIIYFFVLDKEEKDLIMAVILKKKAAVQKRTAPDSSLSVVNN